MFEEKLSYATKLRKGYWFSYHLWKMTKNCLYRNFFSVIFWRGENSQHFDTYDPEKNFVATPKMFWIHCVNTRQKLWIWQVVFISVVYETKWWWAKLIEGFCDPAKKLEIQGPNSLGYILCKNYLECMPTTTTCYFTLLFCQIES